MMVLDEKESRLTCRIAVVVSRFNVEITQRLLDGALERLRELDFSSDQITVAWVPGAVELPLAAQRLAQQGVYDAIVCLGAVIQGDTDHHLYVSQQASDGLARVMLENDLPVSFGVLTTRDDAQAEARVTKGRDAVDAAVEMVALLRKIT